MRCSFSRLGTVALLATLAFGCKLPGREGPVPQSLADCRRLSQQGTAALEKGDQPKAESLLAKAVEVCPIDAEARHRYAESLWTRGARDEAIAQMEEACRLMGEDASLWSRLAAMYLECHRPEKAWRATEEALKLDPKSAEVWAIRGGVRRAVGQPREALADYLRALGYASDDRAILGAVAELHAQLQQPERALQTLQTLADTYSPGEEPAAVLYQMGLAYVALQRFDEGAASFSSAIARGGPTPEMYFHLGEAELLAGRPSAAADAARRALALQPQHQASQALLERIAVAAKPPGNVR